MPTVRRAEKLSFAKASEKLQISGDNVKRENFRTFSQEDLSSHKCTSILSLRTRGYSGTSAAFSNRAGDESTSYFST